MKKTEIKELLAKYDYVCDRIALAFINKQFSDDGEPEITFEDENLFWVADESGGILDYGEYTYTFDDILADLREDAPRGEIDYYTDYAVGMIDRHKKPMSYYAWLHGGRHLPEALGFNWNNNGQKEKQPGSF